MRGKFTVSSSVPSDGFHTFILTSDDEKSNDVGEMFLKRPIPEVSGQFVGTLYLWDSSVVESENAVKHPKPTSWRAGLFLVTTVRRQQKPKSEAPKSLDLVEWRRYLKEQG